MRTNNRAPRTEAQLIRDNTREKDGRFASMPSHKSSQLLTPAPVKEAPVEVLGEAKGGDNYSSSGYRGAVNATDARFEIDFDSVEDPDAVSSRFDHSEFTNSYVDALDAHQTNFTGGNIRDLRGATGFAATETIIEDRVGPMEGAKFESCHFLESYDNPDGKILQTGPWTNVSMSGCSAHELTLGHRIEMRDTDQISGSFTSTTAKGVTIDGGRLAGDWSGSQFQGATLNCNVYGIDAARHANERLVYDDHTKFQTGYDPAEYPGVWVHERDAGLD